MTAKTTVEKNSNNEKHHLFIVPEVISKAKKRWLLFKPKDIIVSEPYEFSLSISNIGKTTFPGGTIKNFNINYIGSGNEELDDLDIPEILGYETHKINKITKGAIGSGIAWFHLRIKSLDNKRIKYYQTDRVIKKPICLDKPDWQDYFYVASIQEVHQRYTNYILLGLTAITVFLFLINLALLLR